MYSPYLAEQNTYHSSFFLLILAATGVWSLKCYTQKKKKIYIHLCTLHYVFLHQWYPNTDRKSFAYILLSSQAP